MKKKFAKLVQQINAEFRKADAADKAADAARLRAGRILLALRKRVEAGEVGDIGWWEWFEQQKFNRGRRDAERVMQLAGAPNPEAALEEERARAREGMRDLRALRAVPAAAPTNVSRPLPSVTLGEASGPPRHPPYPEAKTTEGTVDLAGVLRQARARRIIEAMRALDENAAGIGELVKFLLEPANAKDLEVVRRSIGYAIELKGALDQAGSRGNLKLRVIENRSARDRGGGDDVFPRH